MADVFISYSRRDIEVVSSLCDGLRGRGKTVFVDVGERVKQFAPAPAEPALATEAVVPTPAAEPPATVSAAADVTTAEPDDDIAAERARAEISGIPPSAPWMEELRAAIRRADNIIVVISPDFCASAVCREELDYAVEAHKRLVPVIVRDTPADDVPPALATLNWLAVHPGPSLDADVDRLIEVLDTDVDGLHLHTRLTERSDDWVTRGLDRSLLLRGKDLESAEQWLAAQAGRKPTPTSKQTSYIVASRAAATRRQRGSVAVGLALALVMTGLTIVAGIQWRSAVVQRQAAVAQGDIATSRALAAESGNELVADPQLALLLALRAYDTSHTAQAESAVRAADGASTVRAFLSPPHAKGSYDLSCPVSASGPGAFDPTGQYVVITCNGWAEVWRWPSRHGLGSPTSPYAVHIGGSLSDAIFSRAGDSVLVANSDGQIYQWDWRTSARVRVIGQGFVSPVLYESSGGPIVASEAGQSIAITSLGTGARSTIGVPCCSFPDTSLNPAFAFSPDGSQIATLTLSGQQLSNGTLSVFDVSSGQELFSKAVPNATLPVAVSSTGKIAVAVGESAQVFSVADPSAAPVIDSLVSPAGMPAHCCDVDAPLALAWSPDGHDLAVGSEDLWTRVWAQNSAAPIYLDDSHDTGSFGVAFSPDSQYLLTSGYGSQVWQWQAATPISVPASASVEGTAVSPSGQIFAVAESNNTIVFLGPKQHHLVFYNIPDSRQPAGSYAPVYLAFAQDNQTLVSAGPDDYVRLWRRGTQSMSVTEVQLPGPPTALTLSPHDDWLAAAWVGGVERWNLTTSAARPIVTRQPANYGGLILSLSDSGAMRMLMFPPLNSSSSLTGHLVTLAAGSSHAVQGASVGLPGMPGTFGWLVPGHRLVLCSGMGCYLYAVQGHSVNLLKTPELAGAGVASLTGDQRELYLSTVGGVITAWDLGKGDRTVAVTTLPGAIQADASADYLLVVSDSALTLVPTAQDAAFGSVLKLARSHAVRSLTAAERKAYLSGTTGG